MAYSADTFVADEQPTTAKWNKLWSNDASFNDGTGIADDAIIARHVSALDKSNMTADSNPYKYSAYLGSAQNSANGAYAKINLGAENYDTNSNYDAATNYRYTVPVAGFYQFNWLATISIAAASNDTVAVLYKNGTVISWGNEVEGQGGTGGADHLSLAVSDYIEVYAYASATSAYIATALATRVTGYLTCRT